MSQEKALEEANLNSASLNSRPGFWTILKIWFLIGGQSFGGGPSTIFLIRREFMSKRHWLTDEEYSRFWVLCQLTPGVNIIALSVLIGKKLNGVQGIIASLIGLLLPSTTITILLAATFSSVQNWPPIQAMLKGITPATAGFSALVAIQFSRPLLKQARQESWTSLIFSIGIILGCAILLGFFKIAVVYVLLVAAIISAIGFSLIWKTSKLKKEL